MCKAAVATLAGTLALLALPERLPAGEVAALCSAFALLCLPRHRLCWLLFQPLGFAWYWYLSQAHVASRLDPAREGRELTAVG